HPTDPDTLYVATVGGGIWKTTNATSASPSWLNLSDDWPTLATTTIAFNPLDPTRQSLFAGTGSLRSGGGGGLARGVFRETCWGFTWQRVSTATLGSKRIRAIVPTTRMDPGQVVLVGADDGLYRSTDGGDTFAYLPAGGTSGLPAGLVT